MIQLTFFLIKRKLSQGNIWKFQYNCKVFLFSLLRNGFCSGLDSSGLASAYLAVIVMILFQVSSWYHRAPQSVSDERTNREEHIRSLICDVELYFGTNILIVTSKNKNMYCRSIYIMFLYFSKAYFLWPDKELSAWKMLKWSEKLYAKREAMLYVDFRIS